jgi:Sulfotransferase domain
LINHIAIHSVPRSGSTWLGEILNSNEKTIYKYQPLFSYAFKDRLTKNSSKQDIECFFNDLVKLKDDFLDQREERVKGQAPIFVKNDSAEFIVYKEVRHHYILKNLLEKDKKIRVIGLIRNPLSTINSWLRAPKEFKKELGWNELEEWKFAQKKNLNKEQEFNGFEKWKEVALMFEELKQKYPTKFYLIKYSDLLNNTEQKVKELFDFCGLDFTEQTSYFIKKSSNTDHSNEAYSVFRKNQSNDKWKTQLNPKIASVINMEIKEEGLNKYLI